MQVAVFFGDDLLAEETFEPAYTEDEPNGEDCGVRRAAEVIVSL